MQSDDDIRYLEERSSAGDADASLTLAEKLRAAPAQRDHDRIEVLYLRAYEQGARSAALALANWYEHEVPGRVRDAIHWYEQACETGNALACSYLGLAYQSGALGLNIDMDRAREYADKASKLLGSLD